ncbi:MAG: restriction endonuclease subunit S [Veillonellales bacterium]
MFPKEWPIVRLGDIVVDIQPGFAQRPDQEDSGIGQIRTHNVTPEGRLCLAGLKYVTPSEKEASKYLLQKGDIIFNNTNSEEWVGKTALYDIEEPLLFSNHMTRIRVDKKNIFPEFLARYLHFFWKIGFSRSRAKRWVSQASIAQCELMSFKLNLPTIVEQERILEILKQADAVCIEREEFLKQAKHLPTVLFFEMFGDPDPRINQRWEVEPLAKITQVETGGTPSRAKSEFYNGSIPWVKSTELVDGRISQTEEAITEVALEKSNTKVFPVGTVLLAMYGQGQTRGRTGLLKIAATCNQACAAILPNDKMLPDYIFVWLQCSYERVRALGRGGQQKNLNLNIVRSLKIPKPPIDIQEKFSNTLTLIDDITRISSDIAKHYDKELSQIISAAFFGELTKSWREAHRKELEAWLVEQAELLPKKSASILVKKPFPIGRPALTHYPRRWLMNQLSGVQYHVYEALREWKGTLNPSEDLELFLEEWPIEHLEDAKNHVLSVLNQLAGLGLIARVSIPNQIGDYATAYRLLREEELSKTDDFKRLEALD